MILQKVVFLQFTKQSPFSVLLEGKAVCEHGLYRTPQSPSQMSEDVAKGVSRTPPLHSCAGQHVSSYASALFCVDGLALL